MIVSPKVTLWTVSWDGSVKLALSTVQ
jgi:hypothetical protein